MPVALGGWTTLGRVLDTERDRIFVAFASKCLSNVGSARARGSPRPSWQREQDIQKQSDSSAASRPGFQPCLSFITTRSIRDASQTRGSTQGHLHAQACVPTRMGETGAHGERTCPLHNR